MSPWIVIGAVVVLFPIFAYMTYETINRQKQNSIRLLLDKGAALIRSFEAGARTGMRHMRGGNFRLQHLLTETARQDDIVHLVVTDQEGTIRAHNDETRIDGMYGLDLPLEVIAAGDALHWRIVTLSSGQNVFEIYGRFLPADPHPHGRRPGMMRRMRGQRPPPFDAKPPPPRIIFVGLDMAPMEAALRADSRHALIMGLVLLLAGLAGIVLLFLAQGYRTARASLTRVKAFSDTLVAHMPMGVITVDAAHQVTSLNHLAESLLALKPDRVVGQPMHAVLPQTLCRVFKAVVGRQTALEDEVDCPLPSQRSVPLLVSASALQDESNGLLGYVLLFKDQSEIQDLRLQVARNRRLAAIGRLAAGVAHEIRNPLSSIKGFATYFKERYQDVPQDQQTADIMIQEVDRLNRVVGQLLEFARPIKLTLKATDVQGVVEKALQLIAHQAETKTIRIDRDFTANAPRVALDADRINQVLLNLFINAFDAMAAGGTLGVSIAPEAAGDYLALRVTDTGCGIAAEDIGQVLEPYFTTKPTGTGLGLAIAHNIVKAHQGDIRLRSTVGQGTEVIVLLPLATVQDNPPN